MKRLLMVCVVAAFVVVVGSSPVAVAKAVLGQTPPRSEMLPGKVTVQFTEDVAAGRIARGFGKISVGISSVDQVFDRLGVSDIRPIFQGAKRPATGSAQFDLTSFYELAIPANASVPQAIAALVQNPHVRLAEPVWSYYIDATPNDSLWTYQYNMSPPGPDPQPYNAWEMETGSDSIKIAIIDTGVLYTHPDLADNIWVNPGEDLDHDGAVFDPDDMNGIDDDGNGYVDDVIGYDFVTSVSGGVAPGEDGFSPDNNPKDFNGHGTHVSGIAAAVTNNRAFVTGMAGGWTGGGRSRRGCRIMCVRAGAENAAGLGTLNSSDIAAGIDYARINHANVINASWGGGGYSTPVALAMMTAIADGISFIHSAGNANSDVEGWQDQIGGVVTVAATGPGDQKWTWNATQGSNYGTWITVSAPGEDILSTVSNHYAVGTAYFTGTSMAAPGVVGLNALIRSMMPSLSRTAVDSIITATTDDINPVNPSYDELLGSGRINAFKALSGLANAKFTADLTDANVPFTAHFTDQSPNAPTTWAWTFGDGGVSSLQNPEHTYTTPGIYPVSLLITEPHGLGEEHLRNYIWARADTFAIDSVAAMSGTQAVLNVRLTNTALIKDFRFPFIMANTQGVTLDSFTTTGLRTEYFDQQAFVEYSPSSKKYAISLVSGASASHWLTADTGAILKLYIHVPNLAAPTTITLDTLSQGTGLTSKPKISTIWGDYWPVFKPGKLVVTPCPRGKVTCGPLPIDLTDLSILISYLTTSAPELNPYSANINGVGIIDVSDLSYLIAYLTGSGNPPPPNEP